MDTQPNDTPNPRDNEPETLESQTTIVERGQRATNPSDEQPKQPVKRGRFSPRRILDHVNIYLLLFTLLILLAIVITIVSVIQNRRANQDLQTQITTEPLSQEALDQLRQTDVKVGDPKQILTVEANAIFAGKVLIRDSLEVAGEIKAGGPLTLPGLNVSGQTTLNQIQANQLQLAGNAIFQGQVSVQNNLSVSGSGSFGGALTAASLNIQNLQINGDLQFTRHIDAGGGTPSRTNGTALGGGGTSSVSGTDTAGTVAINTGSNPGPGCFATMTFTQRFNGTPHIAITPVGSSAANLNYYINRSNTEFSICTTNAAPGGQSFAFDYVAID